MALRDRFRLSGGLLSALLVALVIPTCSVQALETADGFPYIVQCATDGNVKVYYLSEVRDDGMAIYMSPDRQAATITATGTAEKVLAVGLGDCSGKTLEELRDGGQAVDVD